MEILGLPLHPLLVHAVVVVGPLCALLTLVYAAATFTRSGTDTPTWGDRYTAWARWIMPVGLILTGIVTAVAESAGEDLAETFGDGATFIHEHEEAGERLKIFMLIFMAVALLLYLSVDKFIGGKIPALGNLQQNALIPKALAVVAGVLAILILVFVFQAGHSGAEAVWGSGS